MDLSEGVRMMETGLETFEAASVGRFAQVFEEAFDRRDFVRMARFYANDAWLIGENTGVIKSRQAVEAFWRAACARPEIKGRTLAAAAAQDTGDKLQHGVETGRRWALANCRRYLDFGGAPSCMTWTAPGCGGWRVYCNRRC
jgi:hypothetical protein